MRTYQQLTYEQRCQISALKKSGCGQRKIAETIETTQPTVSRELARNTGAVGYRHTQAQERTEQRHAEASQPTKMAPDMITVIESKLRVEWSPEQMTMDQISFSDAEYQRKRSPTRREKFLAEMDRQIPWKKLEKRLAQPHPKGNRGRLPYPLSVMLRIYFSIYSLAINQTRDA